MKAASTNPLVSAARFLILAVVFVSYAYFYQGGGWNQNSRFDLVRAMVERGTLRIDAYHENTQDKAYYQGHYYSDKAPGVALLALPVAAIARPLLRVTGIEPRSPRGLVATSYLATVFAVAFPDSFGLCLFVLDRVTAWQQRQCCRICRAIHGTRYHDLGIRNALLGTRANRRLPVVRICRGRDAEE